MFGIHRYKKQIAELKEERDYLIARNCMLMNKLDKYESERSEKSENSEKSDKSNGSSESSRYSWSELSKSESKKVISDLVEDGRLSICIRTLSSKCDTTHLIGYSDEDSSHRD